MDSSKFETAKVYTDLQGLQSLKTASKSANKETLREVAEQFEAVFFQMVLKSMRDASAPFKSDLMSSNSQDMYQSMYDNQLSVSLPGSMPTLTDVIVRQLSQQQNTANKGSAS